jgi:hypothetical protein
VGKAKVDIIVTEPSDLERRLRSEANLASRRCPDPSLAALFREAASALATLRRAVDRAARVAESRALVARIQERPVWAMEYEQDAARLRRALGVLGKTEGVKP